MTHQPRKLSEISKEMSERLLRNPVGVSSSEAAHVALMFATTRLRPMLPSQCDDRRRGSAAAGQSRTVRARSRKVGDGSSESPDRGNRLR
jgi:hypothetical protein